MKKRAPDIIHMIIIHSCALVARKTPPPDEESDFGRTVLVDDDGP